MCYDSLISDLSVLVNDGQINCYVQCGDLVITSTEHILVSSVLNAVSRFCLSFSQFSFYVSINIDNHPYIQVYDMSAI